MKPTLHVATATYLGMAQLMTAEHINRMARVVVGPTPHDPERVSRAEAKRSRKAAKRLASSR